MFRALRLAAVVTIGAGIAGCTASSPGALSPAAPPQPMRLSQAIVRPDYTFSCDPAKYIHTVVLTVNEYTRHNFAQFEFPTDIHYEYYPVAGFCGKDNSFLSKEDAKVYNVSKGRYQYPSIAFNQFIDWHKEPCVALWEEAWYDNIFRAVDHDRHVVLLNVVKNSDRVSPKSLSC